MADAHAEGQQHPLGIYIKIWVLLFVLSGFSYAVDYFQVQGAWRWTLVLLFMFLKSGYIMAVFMHMKWERMSLVLAILFPVFALLVFIGIMTFESNWTHLTREVYFSEAFFSLFGK
jgi:cytochrome c oxidase subunit 4